MHTTPGQGVPPGYKQTEVGVIPENWDIRRLGELAAVTAGGTPSRANPTYWDGDIPWITTSEVDYTTIEHATQFITREGLENSAACLLPPGTILMALYGQGKTRGKVGILGISASTNQACAAISLKPEADRKYVFHFLRSQYDEIRGLSNTGNQENLNSSLVRSIAIPLPTKAEQAAIAAALSDADALIESLEQLLAKKREVKQGAMQDLLMGKRRLPGFELEKKYKLTDLGFIPDDWNIAKLGLHATFRTGPFGSSLHQSDYIYDGIPIVNPMQIIEGKIIPTPAMTITDESARRLGEFLLAPGEVIIGRRGDMGRCAVVMKSQAGWLCGTGSMVIRPKSTLDAVFLQRILSSPPIIAEIENASVGSTMINLNQGTLRSLAVPLPPTKTEQEAIGKVLREMDSAIELVETKLAKARQIKQAMMQELLTGRIRLM
ncbi:MAG: hypothetical protein RLY71_4530 [Pseudomonadota bacterium]|jgi:type I restriction enzyme S subunit